MKRIDRVMARLAEMGKQDSWLADKLGVAPQNVGNWKVRDLPSDRILQVAKLIELRPEYIDTGALPAKAVASPLAIVETKTNLGPIPDLQRLADAIEAVETGLHTTNQMMEPADKAALIGAVYELLAEQNSTAKIFRLIAKGKV